VSGAPTDPIQLARLLLAQSLGREGDALVLENETRESVLTSLRASRDAAPAVAVDETVLSNGERRVVGSDGARTDSRVRDAEIYEAPDLSALAALVSGCSRCALHSTRKNAVFGEGAADARVVCVGEAPGAREDETGRPFVGRAGKLLDRLLRSIGLPRESVYICNVLKSRPPNNRDPLPEEVTACSPYLLRQLALIQPEVIIAFGAFASRALLETKSALGRMRGRVHEYAGYPVVVTYHPAALLRNPGWTRPTWEDLQIVRRLLDGEGPLG